MIGCRPLSETEISTVVDHIPSLRDKCLFILGCRTGLRIAELLSLTVGDVVDSYGNVLTRVWISRRNMKGKISGRSIVLHISALSAIKSWIAVYPYHPTSPLFPSRLKGKQTGLIAYSSSPISRIHAWRIIKQAVNSANLTGKIATHSMRKSFANKVYIGLGKDLLRTRVALGHKSIDSTISYLSFDTAEIDQAILS